MISPEFRDAVEEAAKLSNMTLSNFIRCATSEKARLVFFDVQKDVPAALSEWEKSAGGDFSEARAAKDKNYKKRTLAGKIDKAKAKAKGRSIGKEGGIGRECHRG